MAVATAGGMTTSTIMTLFVVPVLYSLFIVITSTMLTMWFRRINTANEQPLPNGLL